ncbi:PREDICTED: neurogenic locus notch homolog protein 1-like [Priapulus caudatus]|uniref:Neurogenic locus notch homolog protein 1-like n=1 Tax=Priapulus caudatus TaxID=37621 RepID=A0ABM1EGC7_PRICU|nr:PREDICTED: neurogenic locus notch homolog protein 1-like [Priapulus caudatus]
MRFKFGLASFCAVTLILVCSSVNVHAARFRYKAKHPDAGCADGTSEGLEQHKYLAACSGSWVGHVHNSSHLCGDGWRVCSWYDEDTLRRISWSEAIAVDGCYAYNAAHDNGLCRECTSQPDQNKFPPRRMSLSCLQYVGDVYFSGNLKVKAIDIFDAGEYACVAKNSEGTATAYTRVEVTDQEQTGCADGTSEGLYFLPNISACTGHWSGHVKRARHLCSNGWRVCSANDARLLKSISWSHANGIAGCYGYNAENTDGKCSRCHRRNMAGVGKHCTRYRKHGTSCLSAGRIDVLKKGADSDGSGCLFQAGVTTGVLCCRRDPDQNKQRKELISKANEASLCKPTCQNGGSCVKGQCVCPPRYKGVWCQNAICSPRCSANALCISPDKCKCRPGYLGKQCEMTCKVPCYNGGRCRNGECICSKRYWGTYCQHVKSSKSYKHINKTEFDKLSNTVE